MLTQKEYRRARKILKKVKNQKKYEMNEDCTAAQKERRDIELMRLQLGMKPLELIIRACLRCRESISVFRFSGVFMCKECRTSSDARDNDNHTY